MWKRIPKFSERLEAADALPDAGELGHVLLRCEKLLLAECCLSAVFPYRLHWIQLHANREEASDPAGEWEEGW